MLPSGELHIPLIRKEASHPEDTLETILNSFPSLSQVDLKSYGGPPSVTHLERPRAIREAFIYALGISNDLEPSIRHSDMR